jgi:hypothetical protein
MEISKNFRERIRAHFLRLTPQKTGLSAPIPRICLCKSCGISAAIHLRAQGEAGIEQALKRPFSESETIKGERGNETGTGRN